MREELAPTAGANRPWANPVGLFINRTRLPNFLNWFARPFHCTRRPAFRTCIFSDLYVLGHVTIVAVYAVN